MIRRVSIEEIPYHTDSRGWLLKAFPKELVGDRPFGEVYLSGAKPGETKGSHYHERTTEWFCVISGKGTLRLQDIDSGEAMAVEMSREGRRTVEIPPRVAHEILNTGETEMILLALADVPYDPDRPDTVAWGFGDIPAGPDR